jgi:type II secretory pathway component PulF
VSWQASCLLVIAAGGALLLGSALARLYGSLEVRTRLLELLALATARGVPLPPLVARAAAERGGRTRLRLRRVHARLAEGGTLSAACAAGGSSLFPPHVVGAVRAAEGTAALPGALDAAARDATAALHLRHRWLLVTAYPALLVGLLALVSGFGDAFWWADGTWLPSLVPVFLGVTAAALGLGTAAWLASRRLCVLKGPRLLAAERFLRALAPHLAAHVPLPEALRRAAPACGNPAMAAGARDAARELENGADPSRALPEIPLPRFVRARLLLAGNCAALADECALRYRDHSERMLRWALPLALVLLGVVAALQFGGILYSLGEVRRTILW